MTCTRLLTRIKSRHIIFAGIAGMLLAIVCNRHYVCNRLESYALESTQQMLGNATISPDREIFIRSIAQEIGAPEHLQIRKMNTQTLLAFGYANAFAYFPHFCDVLPISATPFLYVSESFLEDLTLAEQRFLIGHEMVHIREQHGRFLQITVYLLALLVLICCILIGKKLAIFLGKHIDTNTAQATAICAALLVFLLCIALVHLGKCYHQRSFEQEADCVSLKTLNSYEGCMALLDRWEHEFRLPNPSIVALSDHPTHDERRKYCLELQNRTT